MPSIRDLYTFYLTAEHLRGRSHVVHIAACTVEELWNRQTKRKERKLVLRFHDKQLALACNKTQAAALERITGSDDFSKWVGHTITLSPSKAPTGADTILISQPPAVTPNGHANGNAKTDTPPGAATVNIEPAQSSKTAQEPPQPSPSHQAPIQPATPPPDLATPANEPAAQPRQAAAKRTPATSASNGTAA